MSKENLYVSISGFTNILSVKISESHGSATAVATIECTSTTKDIGDQITIDLGYDSSHGNVFTGYVKQVERRIPEDIYIVTAYDKMIRAVDFFVVSDDPDNPFSRSNILAENLVKDVMALAGLTSYTYDATSYTLAINSEAEVNLISSYDYCKAVADLLSWHIWCDETGKVHFENRKPYPMSGSSGQPGDTTDETVPGAASLSLSDSNFTDINYMYTEKDLRNRVVVYGSLGVHASASAVSSHLPAGFYKSVVFSSQLIESTSLAQIAANYNLNMLNRLGYNLQATVIGNHSLRARDIIEVTSTMLSLSGNWYVFSADHNWGKSGYTVAITLRR